MMVEKCRVMMIEADCREGGSMLHAIIMLIMSNFLLLQLQN